MRSSADGLMSEEAEASRVRLSYFRRLLVAVALLILVSLPAAALASDSSEAPAGTEDSIPLSALKEAEAAQSSLAARLTDAKAATELPHSDLDRTEALQLLEGVFEPVLQSPAGDFDSLEVAKFLSDNAALVYPSAQESSGVTAGGEAAGPPEDTPALLESSVPLRVTGPDGDSEAVDLSLEPVEGQLQSAAPLEPVAIPQQLGAGIELPNTGIGIELVGAPQERAPSIIEESVAAYPNVDIDTDLAVAPTATGFETLTTMRSPDAPRSQTFRFDLPEGAALFEADGGAKVVRAGQTVLRVQPPSAIDANGANVPVSMTISGDSLTVIASPQIGTAYPVLVDPLYESYSWKNGAYSGWAGWYPFSQSTGLHPGYGAGWGAAFTGIYLGASGNYYYPAAPMAAWTHNVPRWAEEQALGRYPTSYITNLSIQNLYFITGAGLPSPFLYNGIFDPATQKWAGKPGNETVWSYPGNAGWLSNVTVNFENGKPGERDQRAQSAFGLALGVSEAGLLTEGREAYVGSVTITTDDSTAPSAANASQGAVWVNNAPVAPLEVDAADTGLGVKYITFGIPGSEQTITNLCGGQTADPCPSQQHVTYWPTTAQLSALPTGNNYVPITVKDVLGNWNTTPPKALIKVDHAKPTLGFSGTMTEQGALGATLPSYTLKYEAKDGSEVAPQSGVASTEVKVDGKAVEAKYAPGCPTKNCAITKEWTLTASGYSTGSHTVEVIATDAVGLATTKSLTITLGADTIAPQLKTPGTLYSAPEGWVEQKSYTINASAEDPGGYGTTSLVLKIDGTTVKSATGSCPAGGCTKTITTSLNMASYSGGEHPAELVATDGAGRVTKKIWTINVDPKGSVAATEATETLEAFEETEPQAEVVVPVSQAISAEERAAGNDPRLDEVGNNVISSGVPVEATISTDPDHAMVIEATEGPVEIVPAAPSGSDPEIVEDIAAVSSNSSTGTDTIVRPKYNGLLNFQSIRDLSAPELFSWEVALQSGQTLKAIDGRFAAVYYEDGTEAMLIEAMPAADAVGHAVPTHLSVSGGNVVTLTVEHRGGSYVYPVVAGSSFEVGWSTVEVVFPQPEDPAIDNGPWETYNPVQQTNPLTLLPLSVRRPTTGVYSMPAPDPVIGGPKKHRHPHIKYSSQSGEDNWWIELKGWFWTNNSSAWRDEETLYGCYSDSNPVIYHNVRKMSWAGDSPIYAGSGKHLLLWCTTDIIFLYPDGASNNRWKVSLSMWPNGYWRPEIKALKQTVKINGKEVEIQEA